MNWSHFICPINHRKFFQKHNAQHIVHCCLLWYSFPFEFYLASSCGSACGHIHEVIYELQVSFIAFYRKLHTTTKIKSENNDRRCILRASNDGLAWITQQPCWSVQQVLFQQQSFCYKKKREKFFSSCGLDPILTTSFFLAIDLKRNLLMWYKTPMQFFI